MLRLCTAYFPPLDYFAAIAQAGVFTIDTQEHYLKQTFRNRCLIVTSQGVQSLSVPCIKTWGNHTPAAQIATDSAKHWQRDHWRSICTAYNKSPFFLYYKDDIAPFFEKEYKNLCDLNAQITDLLLKKLKLPVERISWEKTQGEAGKDYTPPLDFSPKKEAKFEFPPYLQTFPCNQAAGHLSILDLLFNAGPESASILQSARSLTKGGF